METFVKCYEIIKKENLWNDDENIFKKNVKKWAVQNHPDKNKNSDVELVKDIFSCKEKHSELKLVIPFIEKIFELQQKANSDLNELRKKCSEVWTQLQKTEIELNRQKNDPWPDSRKNDELLKKLTSTQAELQESKKERTELYNKIKEMQENTHKDNIIVQLQKAQTDLDVCKNERIQLNKKINFIEEEYTRFNNQLKDIKAENESLNAEVIKLKKLNEQLKDDKYDMYEKFVVCENKNKQQITSLLDEIEVLNYKKIYNPFSRKKKHVN